MANFSFCAEYSIPMSNFSVDSCRRIWDEMFLYTREGRIVCARTPQSGVQVPRTLSELLSENDLFRLRSAEAETPSGVSLFPFEGGKMLLLRHLFPTTGLGILFLLPSDVEEDYISLLSRLGRPVTPATRLDERKTAAYLGSRAADLARLVGCGLEITVPNALRLGGNSVFSLPCFEAVLLALFVAVRHSMGDKTARLKLSDEDGRVHVWATLPAPLPRETVAFFRALACARGFAFSPFEKEEGPVLYFSPELPDPALVGLKNFFAFR